MKFKFSSHVWVGIFSIALILQSCSTNELTAVATLTAIPTGNPELVEPTHTATPLPSFTPGQYSLPFPTRTPNLTATFRAEVWNTSQALQVSKSTRTPRPTRTPNLQATQEIEEWNAEVQAYFDAGYLPTSKGKLLRYVDFTAEWAQLNWYKPSRTFNIKVGNFLMSGHFKWLSAYRQADTSGCGFLFGVQQDDDHYGVILDRSKILFIDMDYSYGYYRPMGTTRGTGRVNFGNPFDHPMEADFSLIVKDTYAYVFVNKELVGEYTLARSRSTYGYLGLAVLSGTNKDFGTRCEFTNLRVWIPNE
jgi:hypothetical protein